MCINLISDGISIRVFFTLILFYYYNHETVPLKERMDVQKRRRQNATKGYGQVNSLDSAPGNNYDTREKI